MGHVIMKDKLTSIKINLVLLLRRVEKFDPSEQVNYDVLKKLNEIQEKIFQLSDLLEEIEAIVND